MAVRRPVSSCLHVQVPFAMGPQGIDSMAIALRFFVAALAALGMLGGCLVVAGSGFTTSSKRGGWVVFVPAPEAYVMAAIMYVLSALALVWLLRHYAVRAFGHALALLAYMGASAALIQWLGHALW